MNTHPPFALKSCNDESLPSHKRLESIEELAGHVVKAAIDIPEGRLSHQAELVIVTETLCWIVLDTSNNYCTEEKAGIEVRQCRGGMFSFTRSTETPVETLYDYLGATVMFEHGLISSGQRDELLAIEAAAQELEKKAKAENLRKQLAELEGGAA